MAGRVGRPAIPNNLHVLQGNRSKKAAHELKDSLNPQVEIPSCPAHLLPEAKKEWKRISKELEKLRVISKLDRAALAVYCQAYARWVQAEEELKTASLIEETPSGYRQMSVWLQISNRAVDQMAKFLAEFGMSPSSRSRIREAQSPNLDLFEDDKDSPSKFFTL